MPKVNLRLFARPIRGLHGRHINTNPKNKEIQPKLQAKLNKTRLSTIHIKNLTLPVWLDPPRSPIAVCLQLVTSGMYWCCTLLQIALWQAETQRETQLSHQRAALHGIHCWKTIHVQLTRENQSIICLVQNLRSNVLYETRAYTFVRHYHCITRRITLLCLVLLWLVVSLISQYENFTARHKPI